MKKKIKDQDFIDFFVELQNDPELAKAVMNPQIIDDSIEKLQKVNETISYPILICDNPDTELPLVKSQLNFLLPAQIRKSKEPYVVNIKNDINMYKKLYEKYSKQVNGIISKTKESITNLYPPLKKLRDDIKKISEDFENSIKQTSTPLQNRKDNLNKIDYKKYSQEKQKKFKKDKDEIINEISEFLKKVNTFYKNYAEINKNTHLEIEDFVQKFMDLAKPAKELTTFMRKFFKVFESSASKFSDLKDKKKIDEAFQQIKEPIKDFCILAENTKNKLFDVQNIKKEKIEDINGIIQKNKDMMKTLQEESNKISEKINKLREKYGEEEAPNVLMGSVDVGKLDFSEVSVQMDKEKEEINKEAEEKVSKLKKDADDIIKQSRLNLLFIMDITNSMDAYLLQAKTQILDMIQKIQIECAGSEIFLGFIAYKDFSDLDFGENYINLEFTKDYESIKKNIEFLEAEGGGDTPEDLCGALALAKDKNWSGKTRFTILVTDSPCHGEKYHDLKGEQADNYPNGDREGRIIEDYIKFFAQNEISLFCLKINSTTDKMFKIFEKTYESNKSQDSKNKFMVQKADKLFNIVTDNTIKTFQNRTNLDLGE